MEDNKTVRYRRIYQLLDEKTIKEVCGKCRFKNNPLHCMFCEVVGKEIADVDSGSWEENRR